MCLPYGTSMYLSHKIQLRVNNLQASTLSKFAGTARFTYNWGLAEWGKQYTAGNKPSWYKLSNEFTTLKKDSEYYWLGDTPRTVVTGSLKDLGFAFQDFFRRVKAKDPKVGYPKFKKRGKCLHSFNIQGSKLQLSGKRIRVPKLGWIKMTEQLRFPGRVIAATFSRKSDKWFVSLQVDVDTTKWEYPNICKNQAVVGIDLGVKDLAILSTGEKIQATRSTYKHEKALRRLNKELARRTKFGKNWCKTKLKLGRLHGRIANARNDAIHKFTSRMVKDYKTIGIETLHVKGMVRNHCLARAVSDAAMTTVAHQLEYKAELSGSTIVRASQWFPSSKTCSACGSVLDSLPLSVREWTCPDCSTTHDRDINAAINLKNLAVAQTVTACCPESSGFTDRSKTKLSVGQELNSGSAA